MGNLPLVNYNSCIDLTTLNSRQNLIKIKVYQACRYSLLLKVYLKRQIGRCKLTWYSQSSMFTVTELERVPRYEPRSVVSPTHGSSTSQNGIMICQERICVD